MFLGMQAVSPRSNRSFKVCVNRKGEMKHSFLTKTVSIVLFLRNYTFCRAKLPPLAIVSSKDSSPSCWSSPGPNWVELNRLVKVAHLSLQQLDIEVTRNKIVQSGRE